MSQMLAGRYIGPREDLKGKEAILQPRKIDNVMLAQFNDVKTGLGHGWFPFSPNDWQVLSRK